MVSKIILFGRNFIPEYKTSFNLIIQNLFMYEKLLSEPIWLRGLFCQKCRFPLNFFSIIIKSIVAILIKICN